MQSLFAMSFGKTKEECVNLGEDKEFLSAIFDHLASLDQEIASAAPERPVADINKVDLAILRLSVFESKEEKTPKKVIINEAIELAKEFGSESSPKFVNAVLGKLLMG